MKYTVYHRDACRICGSRDVRNFLHFEDQPFTDDFIRPEKQGTEFLAPIDVYWCAACKTAQTQHDVSVSDYYRDYRYTVSNSPFAQQFMQRLAQETFRRFDMQAGDSVIEIGSGDGHQLGCFQKVGARVLGFEPSEDLTRISREAGVPVAQCLFTAETVREIPADMRPAQVVLLTYTFDHLPEPLPFLEAVKSAIDPERGVLIIEVHDLETIMERGETCLFEHEHSIYLTVRTMQGLLERAGFKLLTADLLPENQRRGNSLLIGATLRSSSLKSEPLPDRGIVAEMETWPVYAAFGEVVQKSYAGMRDYVRTRTAHGKRVAGYGAGGRGVMTLAMADLNHADIAYLCDRNPSFYGFLTPRSHVPVVSPERLETDPVDELIVFSFGYMEEIRQQLAAPVANGLQLVSMLEVLQCAL